MLDEGLEEAWLMDGKGGARKLSAREAAEWTPRDGFLWLHLRRDFEDTLEYMNTQAGLDPLVATAMMAQDTRPRFSELEGGTLLILRGVNLNPGAEPEDMISLRLFIEESRIISVRIRKLKSIDDITHKLASGSGAPQNPGEFVAFLTRSLFHHMEPVISDIEDQLDEAEGELLTHLTADLRQTVTELRIQCSELRRYVALQRDVMAQLLASQVKWMGKRARTQLRENQDLIIRLVEALDVERERASILHDEIRNALSEKINRNIYVVSVLTAVFLPITFITGLLGMNVSGIPASESPTAFWIVFGLIFLVVAFEIALFKRFKWF